MKHTVGDRLKVKGVIVKVDKLEQSYIVRVDGPTFVRCYDDSLE